MRNTMTNSHQSGFTIPELLIAVSLAGMMSVLMMAVFVYSYGGLVVEQTRADMVLESQLFLKRMTEDIRVANTVLTTNTLSDPEIGAAGGWVTSDPANILILTQPAVDSNADLIYDTSTGYPYQNEIIYHGAGAIMYRRTLENSTATDNAATTTCIPATPTCPPDILLTDSLKNMTFNFYDIDNAATVVPAEARSVALTVNLEKKIFGRAITVQNTTRMTLRNEN
jgi:prepilin-type N-terminal cleavage/methylation domain-containing protein